MQQEKAVTPEILNEALRASDTIRDVAAKVPSHIGYLLVPPPRITLLHDLLNENVLVLQWWRIEE